MKNSLLCAVALLMSCSAPVIQTDTSAPVSPPMQSDLTDQPVAEATPFATLQPAKSTSETLPEAPNQKPIIKDILSAPQMIPRQNEFIVLEALASDPEKKALTYSWKTTRGFLDNTVGRAMRWRPANFDGSFDSGLAIVTLTVTDPEGEIDGAAVNIFIEPDGSASIAQEFSAPAVRALSIQVNQKQFVLGLQERAQLSAEVLMSNKELLPEVDFSSSSPEKVSIDATGSIQRLAPGTATIYITTPLNPDLQAEIQVIEPADVTPPEPASGTVTDTSLLNAPAVPSNFRGENLRASGVDLKWNAVSGADSYTLVHDGQTLAENIKQTSFRVDNLSEDTLYTFRLRSHNAAGASEVTEVQLRTRLSGPEFPGRIFFSKRADAGSNSVIHSITTGTVPLNLTNSGGQEYTPHSYDNFLFFAFSNIIERLNLSSGERKTIINFQSTRPSVKNGEMLFHGNLNSHSLMSKADIFKSSIDGSNIANVTNNPDAWDSYPAWSPNADNKVAFLSLRDGQYEIYIMKSDGSRQTRLTEGNNVRESHLRWSSDGKQLHYLNSDQQVMVMDIESGTHTQLTPAGTTIQGFALAPDNSHLAYIENNTLFVTLYDNFAPVELSKVSHPVIDWSN